MPRKAKSIEDRAKDAKANGRRLSAAKQALRDSLIVQRSAQGWTQAAIAAEAGIAERTVRDVLREREAVGEALLDRDPIDIVRDLAVQFECSVADFEAMASAYVDTNPTAAIGAKRGADQARERLMLLLQATGRMPRDMGGLGDLMAIRSIASEMVTAMRDLRAGRITVDEAEETFKHATGIEQRKELAPEGDHRISRSGT